MRKLSAERLELIDALVAEAEIGGVTAGLLEKDEHLIFALQNGWVDNNPDDLKNLSGPPKNLQPTASSGVAAIMRDQVAKHAANAERQTTWLKALAAVASVDDLPFIFERGGRNPAILAALRSRRPQNAEALLAPLFDDKNPALRAQAVRLAGVWKVASFAGRIQTLAYDEKLPVALDALISLKPDEVARTTLDKLGALKTPQEAAPLLNALVSRTEGHRALMLALKKPNALSAATAKLALQALNSLGKTDAKLSPLLMEIAGINSALPPYTKAYISNVVKGANTFGNAEEGKKIYEQAGCIACHIPGAAQSKIGPDLSAIAKGLPIDMIVTEVVWPALNVKENYEAATVTMKDGTVVTGFKQTDTADSIGIRDLTGTIRTLKKADTQKIQFGGTLMPDGLTAGMNEQQLAHLIKYLSELGK
jgi:putative heme-binding domain-containing protein